MGCLGGDLYQGLTLEMAQGLEWESAYLSYALVSCVLIYISYVTAMKIMPLYPSESLYSL